jgi:hypothetical protein
VTGFFLALLAALLAGIGARDQVALAALTRVQGARPAALVVAIATCTLTSALAAWASLSVAPMLNGNARLFLSGLALGFAGAELLFIPPPKAPKEPTRSLAALAVVLAAHQITDAARFLIFAIGLAAYAPALAAAGGVAAGALLLGAAWSAPDLLARPATRTVRRAIGGLLLLAGIGLALSVADFTPAA